MSELAISFLVLPILRFKEPSGFLHMTYHMFHCWSVML